MIDRDPEVSAEPESSERFGQDRAGLGSDDIRASDRIAVTFIWSVVAQNSVFIVARHRAGVGEIAVDVEDAALDDRRSGVDVITEEFGVARDSVHPVDPRRDFGGRRFTRRIRHPTVGGDERGAGA